MAMIETAADRGNLAQVREALHGPTIEEVRQPHPFTHWYMIAAHPGQERKAADGFRRDRIRAYWPNYSKLVATRREQNGRPVRRMMLMAMMPGCIFSPIGASSDFWDVIERVPGVVNVVRTHSGNILSIVEEDIQLIRRIEAGKNTPEPVSVLHKFKMHEKVRFLDDLTSRWGPGKISKLANDGRITIDVSLMGRMTAVIVLPHQIERM